jgi:hypothetical protein
VALAGVEELSRIGHVRDRELLQREAEVSHGDSNFRRGASDARLRLRQEGAAKDVLLVSLVEILEDDYASERPGESEQREVSITEACNG